MKKFILIIILFTISCDYKPIYFKNDQLVNKFSKIILEGDGSVNNQLKNELDLVANPSSNQELTLTTSYKIEVTSKNSKGQIASYRSIMNCELIIKKNNEILLNKNLVAETNYNNKDNKFELTKYQNEIKKNLTNKIAEEIILFLNLV